jgi:hypothetical protein
LSRSEALTPNMMLISDAPWFNISMFTPARVIGAVFRYATIHVG